METPGFFTLAFHSKFFPGLLARKWRETANPPQQSPFANHVPLELTLLPIACLFLIGLGLPRAINHSSLGMVLSFLGIAGLTALLVMALKGTSGQPATYEDFSVSIFLFILTLGVSAGIFYGSLTLRASLLGAAVGYPLGVSAGLYNQKLGFLAFLPVLASRLGMIGLIATDLVLIFGRR